jgi:glycosyltransferase involved in cell wall biosynthesis
MISVIIPTFNRLPWLQECLTNLNSQDCDGRFEVIVIDDGSTDGTNDYLKQSINNFTFRLLLLTQNNRGPAAARNYGINTADGGILAFLDDDSIPHQNWLIEIISSFRKLPAIYAVVKGRTKMHGYSTFGAFMQHHFDDSDSWITNNIAYRKEVFDKVGLFDEKNFTLAAWEDLDLGYRIQRGGFKRYYNQKAVVYHPRENNLNQLKNKYRINGYGFYQFINKWIHLDPIFTSKIIFWELINIHYILPFIKDINYVKYIKGLRLAYQLNGIAQGIRLRGKFGSVTKDTLQ